MPTLDEAVRSLHKKAVVEKAATSTIRLQVLAEYCIEQLANRGLRGAKADVDLPGGARTKNWDVV